MIDHTGIVVSDFERSKIFYSSALSSIGYSLLLEFPATVTGSADVAGFGEPPKPDFWVIQGRPNDPPLHVAFRVSSRALVDVFYRAALAAGGKTMALPACGRTTIQTTTAPSCSTQIATISKPYVITRNDGGKARQKMIERYSFVTVTTENLERARDFWAGALGFPVTEEQSGQYFIVNAGGPRLCVDLADEAHQAGSSDPIIGFKVASVVAALDALAKRGIKSQGGPVPAAEGAWSEIRDPDGRIVILTEGD